MTSPLRQIALFAVVGFILFATPAFASDRTADEILADIEKVQYPSFDRTKSQDKAYNEQFLLEQDAANVRRADLILELYKAHPKHEKIGELLPTRWRNLLNVEDATRHAEAQKEMDQIIAADPTSKLAIDAQFVRAHNAVHNKISGYGRITKNFSAPVADFQGVAEVIETFIRAAPGDERAAQLFGMLADAHKPDSPEQLAVYERIVNDFPNAESAKYASGKLRQAAGIGKPFELTFHDAITNETVDMKSLRDKVVVIDFWATWCGPCVADMPHLKELYSKHHEKGVEFIGVSLDLPEDKGGLEKLKKFVAEKEIPWPQYYQGNGWDSDFSRSWGINSIPALFVVDKKGHLRSVKARGKLEELIPELLAE